MNNLAKIAIVLVVFFCGITSSNAQNQSRTLRKSQSLDGLSAPVVLTVHQDALGFMWFGTTNGLYRYDGYEFVKYQHKKGDSTTLSKNAARKILCEDNDGNLWLLSGGWSLDRYNAVSDNITRFDDQIALIGDPQEIDINGARSVCFRNAKAENSCVTALGYRRLRRRVC